MRRNQSRDNDYNIDFELIKPCKCGKKWHRVCIREHIINNYIKQCPDCGFVYAVGATDCYAIFNKKMKNSLLYKLVIEFFFFLAIIIFSETIRC